MYLLVWLVYEGVKSWFGILGDWRDWGDWGDWRAWRLGEWEVDVDVHA